MGNNCSLDQVELEVLCYEFSDEVLEDEAATGSGKVVGNITLYYCTALYLSPSALSSREINMNSGSSNPNLADCPSCVSTNCLASCPQDMNGDKCPLFGGKADMTIELRSENFTGVQR